MKHDVILSRIQSQSAQPAATTPGDAQALAPAATPAPHFDGTWVNEMNSTMTLRVHGSQVTGTYTSADSDQSTPIAGPIVGYVNGDVISFVVNWPLPAITAWSGQLVKLNGKVSLFTLWHMSVNLRNPEDPTKLWESIYAGSDTFTRATA